eukprot:scaffold282306_cov48-Prasinocladus_malaysianus.AAC.1
MKRLREDASHIGLLEDHATALQPPAELSDMQGHTTALTCTCASEEALTMERFKSATTRHTDTRMASGHT